MQIISEPKLNFDDVLIRPKRTSLESRADVELVRTFKMPHSSRTLTGIPLIASNMDTVGTMKAAFALAECKCFTALHKFIKPEEHNLQVVSKELTFIPIDLEDDWNTVNDKLHYPRMNEDNGIICIDVANGYQERFIKYISNIRERYPNLIIMAGNVVTPDMTEALIVAGADIVKIGIGPGSQCETRKVTGIGYPQLSAIIECADAAHGLKGLICADGGCKTSGDIAKAFGAGADFVMLGTMLAGHKENILEEDRKELSEYTDEQTIGFGIQWDEPYPLPVKTYGMSSKEAMDKHHGGVAPYRSSEGKTSEIDYRGTIKNTINQILGGLRSTCTYVGASNLKELSKRTTFVIVNK